MSNQRRLHWRGRIYIFAVNGYHIKNKALQDSLSYSLIFFHPPPLQKKTNIFFLLQSGLERSMEEAVAEGDVAKAEEMSDRLAAREVRSADKGSLGVLPPRRIGLMDPWPFSAAKTERNKKSGRLAALSPAALFH